MVTTGTAICPYCAGVQERVMKGEHVASGPLVTDHAQLLRHRDESADLQVDILSGRPASDLEAHELEDAVVVSRPAMREIEIDGLRVKMPGGLRPIFYHHCPTARHRITLYADTEGGSVQ